MENAKHVDLLWDRKEHQSENIEANDLDLDEGNQILCRACAFPIFSTSYQRDESGHFLHKCCTKLPKLIMDHPSHLKRPLHLHDNFRGNSDRVTCDNCNRKCKGFFYQCGDESCIFTLDVLCTATVKILHTSHKHELVPFPFPGRAVFTCGACESTDKDDVYFCTLCSFCIHQTCASLPSTILHEKHGVDVQPPHALSLIYHYGSVETPKLKRCKICSVCHEEFSFSTHGAIYICIRCDYGIHVKCAVSDWTSFKPVPSRHIAAGLTYLPMRDEFTSLVQYLLQNRSISNSAITEESKGAAKKLHKHPLIFHENYGEGSSNSSPHVCNACIQPISLPFYSCSQCSNFFLHGCCADLPLQYQHPLHRCTDTPLTLHPRSPNSGFFAQFQCKCCLIFCDGFAYQCEKCKLTLDVRCALLPEVVTHKAHGKSHILFLSNRENEGICYGCHFDLDTYFYECWSCPNFKVHVDCALLPSDINHKFDRHLLKLTSFKFSTSRDEEDYCEICEKSMNFKDWFYHCEECVTSFHNFCVPSVDRGFSNTKFGGTISVKCHNCPLTSIRLLTSYSYTCGHCGGTIVRDPKPFYDLNECIAFECTKCRYWLHYDCAEEEREVWEED